MSQPIHGRIDGPIDGAAIVVRRWHGHERVVSRHAIHRSQVEYFSRTGPRDSVRPSSRPQPSRPRHFALPEGVSRYAQFMADWNTVLDDSDIDVDVDKGVVRLNGTVKSAAAKTKAASIAKGTTA